MTANGKQGVSVIVGLCLIAATVMAATVIQWIFDVVVDDATINLILDLVVAAFALLLIGRIYAVSINWQGMAAFFALLFALIALIVGWYFGSLCVSLLSLAIS